MILGPGEYRLDNTRGITIRLRFRKIGPARFLSHLDLVLLFQRAFRRALLPIAFSMGKVPRPRINIPYPLPLGVETEVDVLEVNLVHEIHLEDVKDRLNDKLPEGIEVLLIRKALQGERRSLSGLEYSIQGDGLPDCDPVKRILNCTTLKVARKRKERLISVDIRPFVESIQRIDARHMTLTLKVQDGRSTRPDEVLDALGLNADTLAGLHIVRTGIVETVQ